MGKRIIQQARGKGSLTYQAKKSAFIRKIGYPGLEAKGEGEIVAIEHSAAHSAPLAKIMYSGKTYYNPAFNGAFVGQKVVFEGEVKEGNVLSLAQIPTATSIFNIECNPGDGGKMIRTAGSSAILSKRLDNGRVIVTLPNRKTVTLHGECRATVGVIAGDGRLNKPFMTAGRKHYKMKARNKLWPRTSAIKVNAVDHPFGSGRGKRAKPKIAKRNAPPGRKVGHLRPRRTGHKR
jgi:large subunit ribosomal protein L2